MTFEVRFVAEGVFKIKADSWNKAEETFDNVIKEEIMKPMPKGSICEVVCIKKENENGRECDGTDETNQCRRKDCFVFS